MAAMTEPWSKKHKQVTRAGDGGMSHSLSNSYAEPLTHAELVEHALARGDRAIVEAYNDHGLGYTPNGGSLDLREEIAQLYGPAIGPENILVFTGAQVALQTAALALARDCHSIVFTPGYQSTVEAAVHAGGEVTQIQLEATRGWQIDPEQVKAAIRPNTRYMVLNEPYNPAGTLMSHELQAEIMSIAGEEIYAVFMCHFLTMELDHLSRQARDRRKKTLQTPGFFPQRRTASSSSPTRSTACWSTTRRTVCLPWLTSTRGVSAPLRSGNVFFAPFYTENDLFTKTGSGKT
jgi:hypothetical protein